MQINSNSFKFSREENNFYSEIESTMKKIAENYGKHNIEKISATIDKDSATITFIESKKSNNETE